jgi:hypothetical protein
LDTEKPISHPLSQETRAWQDSLGLSTEQLQVAAANHEAGHAGYDLMYPEDLALIRTGILTDADGYVSGLTTCCPGRPSTVPQAIIMIGNWYAGEVGEEILSGRKLPGGASNDYANAVSLAKQFMGAESPYIPQMLAVAQTLARYALARHETNLRRLAKAILLRQHLTGQEATAIWNQR